MGKVDGLKSFKAAIAKRLQKAQTGTKSGKASVIVGYTQNYAIYVHENLDAAHPVGNAKFLERPFRDIEPNVPHIVGQAVRKGATLPQALMIVGLAVQRASQEQVPVDTGALKGSAFTREVK